jgi:hypothetical protein
MVRALSGQSLEIALTTANSAAQAWYGYDQGVISGILIGSDFIKTFPQTKVSSIQGITASCFSVSSSTSHEIGYNNNSHSLETLAVVCWQLSSVIV